ncbi:hypothetical protein JTB14_004755 [Gonioctena quinquepunctata]|nr:hypothetical protein JTB14_004755 [Gonioctena quinquepunctata]
MNGFKCGKKNHTSDQCYAKSRCFPSYPRQNFTQIPIKTEAYVNNIRVECRYCKKFGHSIAECRKRIYNNSRKNSNSYHYQICHVNESPCISNEHSPSKNHIIEFREELLHNNSSKLDSKRIIADNHSEIFVTNSESTNSSCINLPLLLSITKSTTLLVDTGADISIVELSEVDDEAFIHTDGTIKIKGIISEYVSSIGISYGEIKLSNDISIMHKFLHKAS